MRKTLSTLLLLTAALAQAEFEKPPEPKNVPALMTTYAGETVTTREQWEKIRRPELMKTFLENEYGVRPVERPADLRFEILANDATVYNNRATKKIVRGTYSGPHGKAAFTFAAWIPKSSKRAPAFIHLSPRPATTADDPNSPRPVYYLPAEYIISRGYAVLASCDYDFSPDWERIPDVPTNGVFKAFGPTNTAQRKPTEWGILSAWAWGASRILDWVETEPAIDTAHVGVVGLSRNGKTALIAGAMDTRFAMAISCCSGCSGAKLNHIELWESEHIKQIMVAERWFCPNYKKCVKRDDKLPFDQHEWLAMIAPRLLYISSASEDAWAGQRGEFWAAKLASPAWELYGKSGLIEHGFPAVDCPINAGHVGYHIRTGVHDITRYDWQCYLDFADAHDWRFGCAQ